MHDSKIYNARVTVEIGRGFYNVGLELAIKVLQNKSEARFYTLSPAVVNLTFATELYLKALRNLIDMPDSGTHELLRLYSGIPAEEKKKIEENYMKQTKESKIILGSYRIKIFKGEDDKKQSGDDDLSFGSTMDEIKAFLKKHNNAFILWRYFYEIKGEKPSVLEYDFSKANSFILAVAALINEKLDQRGSKMEFS